MEGCGIKSFSDWMHEKRKRGYQRMADPAHADLINFKIEAIARASSMLREINAGFEKVRGSVAGTTGDHIACSALLELQNTQCAQIIQSLQNMLETADGEFVSMLMERDDGKKKAL